MYMMPSSDKKSVWVAYFLWLTGGLFGAHHFYLRRDRQAFIWWSTLGAFCFGWFGDLFNIPKYVREANDDPKYIAELVETIRRNKKPPFSTNRFTLMLMVAYTWGQMMLLGLPPEDFLGFNFKHFSILVPLACALGVWTVGNCGKEQGSFWVPLLAAYLAYPIRYYIFDEAIWITFVALMASLAFDSFAKKWRKSPPKKKSFCRRIQVLGVCAMLYLMLWFGYFYFHGTITDADGDEVPVYEALHHFFTSPWWVDMKQCLYDTYVYAQHHGWYEIWRQIVDMTDPRGEQNAYKVLGLGPNASQQEITSSWRRLSRENHPDKVKDPSLRQVSHEKFMEIQQAYEILSDSKSRRHRKNKKDNSE